MTQARKELVSLDATPYYHCVARCVRRAFLCGEDQLTGKNFEHRRQWILDRVTQLASIFAVDVCAYAIMSNHYHLVLRLRPERAAEWSVEETLRRWCELFSGPLLVQRFLAGQPQSQAELDRVYQFAEQYRQRLSDLSWYMRCLNEAIARMANAEDGCKGRFWEGRFKSQALLDEAALLSCMAYVDLNPIRAGMAETPEASDFTSIQARIEAWQAQRQADSLVRFQDENPTHDEAVLPFTLRDYFELVDWSGRAIRADKRGAIPEHLPKILIRLGIEPAPYAQSLRRSDYPFQRVVGRLDTMRHAAQRLGQRFLKGSSAARLMFGV